MTTIRVTPASLREEANKTAAASAELRSVGNHLSGCRFQDPHAQEQLGNRLGGMTADACREAQSLASLLDASSATLVARASSFESADTASASALTRISASLFDSTSHPLLAFFKAFALLPLNPLNAILALGALLGLTRKSNVPVTLLPPSSSSGIETEAPTFMGRTFEGIPTPGQAHVSPQPEAVIRLVDVKPENYDDRIGCVPYAQARRPDLGRAGGDGGAANYIDSFRDKGFEFTQDTDLNQIKTGYAIVWPRTHEDLKGSPGYTYGHVAIVEHVDPNFVIVSQAGFRDKTNMKIPRSALLGLFIIGPTED